jgi:hypothetical protein
MQLDCFYNFPKCKVVVYIYVLYETYDLTKAINLYLGTYQYYRHLNTRNSMGQQIHTIY